MKKQENNKRKFKIDKIVLLRAVLLLTICFWAILVFNFSSQNGPQSSGLSRKVVEFFVKDEQIINMVEPYVRKLAHFSEYALGGVLFLSLFATYKEYSDNKQLVISILLGILYASSDEIHQLMVPFRKGSIVDVFIDMLGFSTGACSMLLIIKVVSMVRSKNKKLVKA